MNRANTEAKVSRNDFTLCGCEGIIDHQISLWHTVAYQNTVACGIRCLKEERQYIINWFSIYTWIDLGDQPAFGMANLKLILIYSYRSFLLHMNRNIRKHMTHWPFIFLVSRQQGESSIEGTPGAQQGEPCENDERLPQTGGYSKHGFQYKYKKSWMNFGWSEATPSLGNPISWNPPSDGQDLE